MDTMSMSDGWLRVEGVGNRGRKFRRSNPKTPYYFFMMEQRSLWLQEGKWNASWSTEKLVQATLPLWNQQKADPGFLGKFVELHRVWRIEQKGDLENKFDSMGRSLADIAREATRRRKKVEEMEQEIADTVGDSGTRNRRNAHMTKFYVAHFNYLCKTDEDFYIPCEAAVVEFSLEGGVTRCWQEFISPLDSIPTGYKYRCIRNSRVTHNLTLEFQHYECDYKRIMESLIEFMSGRRGDLATNVSQLPPLYLMTGTQIDAGESVVRFMLDKAGLTNHNLRLFPLPKLLFAFCPQLFPSVLLAEALLEEDPYSHHAGLACWFHESLCNPHHCSLSISRRLVFSFFESVRPAFSRLVMIPGRHLPLPQEHVNTIMDPNTKLLLQKTNYVTEERINRKVPNPGGLTSVPPTFDPSSAVSLDGGKCVNFPGPKEGNPLPSWTSSWTDRNDDIRYRHKNVEQVTRQFEEINIDPRSDLLNQVVSVRPKLNKANLDINYRCRN